MPLYRNEDIESITCSKQQTLITWHMTGWCNFHCPYCITKSFQTDWISEEKILEIAAKLNEYINKYRATERICLRMVGGEVTFYDLPKILACIEHIDKLNMATNLSNNLDVYKNLIKYCAERKLNLILQCSRHAENKHFKEKLIELTKWCRENRYKDPHMMIVVQDDFNIAELDDYLAEDVWKIRLSRCRNDITMANEPINESLLQKVEDYNNYYDRRTVSGTKTKPQYWKVELKSQEPLHFLSGSDLTNHLDKDGFIPDGFYCSAGRNSLTILPNGDITLTRCDFLKDRVVGTIFNFDEIVLPQSPILCELNKTTSGEKRCDLCGGTNLVRAKELF